MGRSICLYCGSEISKVGKGEHILQQAIGGTLTIKNVCNLCNNAFSAIDRELCSRSPVSMIAARELGNQVWQTWDIDHSAGNLLLEAEPDFQHKSMRVYPQIVFESSHSSFYGDHKETRQFGNWEWQRFFGRHMMNSFRLWNRQIKNTIHFKKVEENPNFLHNYRYPPRIFARRPLREFKNGMTFEIRYRTPREKRLALCRIDNWTIDRQIRRERVAISSRIPVFRCFYDRRLVLRALAKVGINLLANFCRNTPVNQNHFSSVIGSILGQHPVTLPLLSRNGFVWKSDLKDLNSDASNHVFRLLHLDNEWHVYSAFFGGQIGSHIRFTGPNREEWKSADVTVPIKSSKWEFKPSNIFQPIQTHIDWDNVHQITPSLDLLQNM